MRLTNYIRDAYITAVLADVPKVDHTEEIRKLVIQDIINQLPADVKKVWNNPDLQKWVKLGYSSYFNISVAFPWFDDAYKANPTLSAETNKKAQILSKEQAAQATLRSTLHAKLKRTAYGCTTRKQLVELLPEFEKYLPEDTVKAIKVHLPVATDIVSDFVKAGWPTKKAKAT